MLFRKTKYRTFDSLTPLQKILYKEMMKVNFPYEINRLFGIQQLTYSMEEAEYSILHDHDKLRPLKKMYYKLVRLTRDIRDIPRKIKWFWQRGRRGYADCDVWGFDGYLAGVISGGLTELYKHHHGYPDVKVGSPENWDMILLIMADVFRDYAENEDIDLDQYEADRDKYGVEQAIKNSEIRYNNKKKKMALLIEYWGNLWD